MLDAPPAVPETAPSYSIGPRPAPQDPAGPHRRGAAAGVGAIARGKQCDDLFGSDECTGLGAVMEPGDPAGEGVDAEVLITSA